MKKLEQRIEALERAVAALRPASSPGMITNRTTRGVVRRPLRNAKPVTAEDSDPRWS